MAFANNNSNNPVNPVTKFLTFKGKSTDGFFVSYNKETKENEKEDLNKFIIIDTGYTVKGGKQEPDGSYIGYFSNEIKSWDEKLRVMMNGGALLSEGYYSDIKERVKSEGGVLHLCITILDLNDGMLKEFFLKGQAFFNFTDGILKKASLKIIEFTGPELIKGKAFDYNQPTFKILDEEIKEDIAKKTQEYSNIVDTYYAELRVKYNKDDTVKDDTDKDDTDKDDTDKDDTAKEEKQYAKPEGVDSDQDKTMEGAKEVQGITEENKKTVNPEDEISIDSIPF